MQRVAIVGCAGAGKTTLALALAQRTGLPVVHLDGEFWNAGWVPTPDADWAARVAALAARERWILDGDYGGTMEARLERADTIVFLDVPFWRCLWRVLARRVRHHGRVRPELPDGCRERLDAAFLAYVLTYDLRRRRRVLERIERVAHGRRVEVLRGPADVARFLETL